MMKVYYITILIVFNTLVFSQNNAPIHDVSFSHDSSYINKNIRLLSCINLKDSFFIDFKSYNFYFFGEQHNSSGVGKIQGECLKLLQSSRNIIFTEFPVTYTELFNKYVYQLNVDTSFYKFSFFSKNNEYNQLIRCIYYLNRKLPLDERIKFIPIDVPEINNIEPYDILQYYSSEKNIFLVKSDLDLISNIRKRESKKKKIKKYEQFYQKFLENKDSHVNCIGLNNYLKIDNYLKGLDIYKRNLNSFSWYKSSEREDFMFKNMSFEVKSSQDVNFICFNGHFHITLNKPKEWVGIKNWESLAYKIKVEYPQKKVCSIYLMNRNDDPLSDEYFPTEKKLILENTKPGETYLIRLDGENSPFKELSEKFQYIVVW